MKKNITIKLLAVSLLLSSLVVPSIEASQSSNLLSKLTVDSLEKQDNISKSLSWGGNFWVGSELNKLYVYSEGSKPKNSSSESENQIVISHAIAPYWDIQAGFGYDKKPNVHKNWGVVALQGMTPYFIETRAALLIGNNSNLGLRLEADYKALLTQKLVLSPSVSTALYSKDIPNMGLGKGLSSITAALRLSYEIKREFAPYIGIQWNKNYGNTNNFEAVNETYFVAGLKFWF